MRGRMAKQQDFRKFDEAIALLRKDGFGVQNASGASNRVSVTKYDCSAGIERNARGGATIFAFPGPVIAGEIGKLVHKGYQQFFKTSKLEVPATAGQLTQLAQFTNELKQDIGSLTLWNESLGTVSEDYIYDRVKGRDLPEAARPKRPWEVAASAGNGK
jgi:hypothetical protein